MDALGIRVGSGNAAMERVMVLGSLTPTLTGGGLIGWMLARSTPQIKKHETKENQKKP